MRCGPPACGTGVSCEPRSTTASRASTISGSASFVTNASAPASSARSSAFSPSEPVSNTTGVNRRLGSSRSRRITAGPSMSGITPSTTIAAGRSAAAACNPSAPFCAVCVRYPTRLELRAQRVAKRRAVVDDEHRLRRPRRELGASVRPAERQHRAQPRDEPVRVVRLADVVGGAEREAAQAVRDLRVRRQHDYRHARVARIAAQLRHELDARAVRQPVVEDRREQRRARDRRARLAEARARDAADAGGFERLDEIHADRQAVVEHEHAGHAHRPPPPTCAAIAAPTSCSGNPRSTAPHSNASRGMP